VDPEKARGCSGSTEVPLEIILEDVEPREKINYLSGDITVRQCVREGEDEGDDSG
jgi:hypothetical protein